MGSSANEEDQSSLRSYRNYIRRSAGSNGGILGPRGYAPVLAPWSTVQIDDNLEVVVGGPSDDFVQVRQLARDVRLIAAVSGFEGPVSNGNTDVVEAG